MTNPKNILIRMPNWIGDAVMGAPLPEEIKKNFPEAKVTLLCQGVIDQLFLHDPFVDEIIAYQKPSGWIHHIGPFSLIDDLKKGHYDTGLLLTNSFSSAWWFFRGNVKNRIGFKGNLRDPLLNFGLPLPANLESEHLTSVYKKLLAPLGCTASLDPPKLYVTEEEKEAARAFLEKEGAKKGVKFIGINPGAAYGSAKCWPPERFRRVAEELLKEPENTLILFGDSKTKPLTDQIAEGLGDRVINLAARTTLRELMAFISVLDCLLTNDSGPMHIASALNTPLVALFGSTNPIKTGPLLKESLVIYKQVECSPCYKRVCPIDFRCMTRISPEEVVKALHQLIHHDS